MADATITSFNKTTRAMVFTTPGGKTITVGNLGNMDEIELSAYVKAIALERDNEGKPIIDAGAGEVDKLQAVTFVNGTKIQVS